MIFQRWSKYLWDVIHCMCLQSDMYGLSPKVEFLETLDQLMDCESCKLHFRNFIKDDPPRYPYFEWSVRLHNDVDKGRVDEDKYHKLLTIQ